MASKIPRLFGRYLLVEKLDDSEEGRVYQGYQYAGHQVQISYAVKYVSEAQQADEKFMGGLKRQAKLALKFQHISLAKFFETASVEGQYYSAIEYVEGVSLQRILQDSIKEKNPIAMPFIYYIAIQMASGLDYLHRFVDAESSSAKEFFHGGINPASIMIGFSGEVKIADFGFARLGWPLADSEYASPTRVRSGAVSAVDDIFGLGIILWELLTGTRYYGDLSEAQIVKLLKEFRAKDPRMLRPEVGQVLANIVLNCLQSEGFDGFEAMEDVLAALLDANQRLNHEFKTGEMSEFLKEKYKPELMACENRKKVHATELEKWKVTPPPINRPPRGFATQDKTIKPADENSTSRSIVQATKQLDLRAKPILALVQKPGEAAREFIPQSAEIDPRVRNAYDRGTDYDSSPIDWLHHATVLSVIGALVFASYYYVQKNGAKLNWKTLGVDLNQAITDKAISTLPKTNSIKLAETALNEQAVPTNPIAPVAKAVPVVQAAPVAPSAGIGSSAPKPSVSMSTVYIRTSPAGAKIWMDGNLVHGLTPGDFAFPVGKSISLVVEKKGYRNFSTIMDAATRTIDVDLKTGKFTDTQ
jgi:serine/threonine protein kinase